MRLPHFMLVGLFLVAISYAQGIDEMGSDDFSTESKSPDSPSLPKTSHESVDQNAKVMEGPSLPTEEIDLLAAPEMPLNKEDSEMPLNKEDSENQETKTIIQESITESTASTASTDSSDLINNEKKSAENESKPENMNEDPEKSMNKDPSGSTNPFMSAPDNSKLEESKVEEATIVPKSNEESTSSNPIELDAMKTETPKITEIEPSTAIPELIPELKVEPKSTESTLTVESMNTDPFQQGTKVGETATEKSKEEDVGVKSEDSDLKTSAEPIVPIAKITSEETETTETPIEPKSDMETAIDLKERPLVPVIREDEKSIEVTTTISSELPIGVTQQATKSDNKMEQKSIEVTTIAKEEVETTAIKSEDLTTQLPNESNTSEEHKLLITSAPIMSESVETLEDSDKSSSVPGEKITKVPADRPQFEEPKQETTEKPLLSLNGDETKKPEEFGHGTEPPAIVPTAETRLMTTESSESNNSETTKTDSLPETTQTSTPVHSNDEEGLFAGDMKNLFVNHQNETSTIAAIVLPPKENEGVEPKLAEEITEPTVVPEPTAEPTVVPEPTAEPTVVPEPTVSKAIEIDQTDSPISHPEPKAEPEPKTNETDLSPVPEPTAEPEPSPGSHVHNSHPVHPQENTVTDTMKTPFSLRFTNIDFTSEFNNLNSGAARKLHDQIYDDLSRVFESTLGENYVGFELLGFQKGSVIVNGQILSRDDLGDPSMVAAKLEDTLQKEGSRLGGNNLDLKSVYVDGILSKGGADMNGQDASAAANTGYIVGGSIAIGVLIMAFIVFAVIVFGVNARRRNKSRTLKLKEELSMAEHGRSPFNNGRNNAGGGPVNLMSYGNSTSGQSSVNAHQTTANTTSPMLLNSSQFTAPQGFQPST